MDPFKLRVRIGQHVFSAEGPEESVKGQFERFLSALSAITSVAVSTEPDDQSIKDAAQDDRWEAIPLAELELVFVHYTASDVISLMKLPRTAAPEFDAMMCILYG